jgi:site-specific DNA-methyltransferase (adenine-specific)
LGDDRLILGDSIAVGKTIEPESAHLILSDIPYGIGADDWDVIHDNANSAYLGSSPAQARAGAVFKRRGKPLNGWSEADRSIPRQYYDWVSSWAPDWLRVLVPGGSAMVFAGRRLAHRCACAFEDSGFTYKDTLAWEKDRAPHRAQRVSLVFDRRGDEASAAEWSGWRVGNLRPIFEPILWFTKPYRIGSTIADNALAYGVGPYDESALGRYGQGVGNVLRFGSAPGDRGSHPTQKPLELMRLLVELSTRAGQLVYDPFCGSGTTLLAARDLGRRYLGIERDSGYWKAARSRLGHEAP